MKNMFSKVFKKPRELAKEEAAREVECMQAIGAILQAYNCKMEGVLKGDHRSIFADVIITALPKPQNDPGSSHIPPDGPGQPPIPEVPTDAKADQEPKPQEAA